MGKTVKQIRKRYKQKAITERLRNLEKQTEFYLKRIQTGDAVDVESARYHLQGQVDALHYFFEQTENPLFAWRALLVCHDAGLSFPEWLSNYLYKGGLEIVNKAYREGGRASMKDTLYKDLGFNMRGQGGAPGQFKTMLRGGAALDGLFEHEIRTDGTQDSADSGEAINLIETLLARVEHDIEIQKKTRLRYDKHRGAYRLMRGVATGSFINDSYKKHGAKLNIPAKTVNALADRGPDESGDELDRIIETLARHLRKTRKIIS